MSQDAAHERFERSGARFRRFATATSNPVSGPAIGRYSMRFIERRL